MELKKLEKQVIKMKIIAETVVGSHIWNMNHKGSDIDLFQIYLEPTRKVLDGTSKKESYFKQIAGVDTAIHEAGKVVNMLLAGNINFIVGVLSPLVQTTSDEFRELRLLVEANLAKNCYYSINGLAIHNKLKYEGTDKMTDKRWNQIIRSLEFGIRILKGEGVQFKSVENGSAEVFEEKLACLLKAFETSSIPEKPNEKLFRDWLYDIRMRTMLGKNY